MPRVFSVSFSLSSSHCTCLPFFFSIYIYKYNDSEQSARKTQIEVALLRAVVQPQQDIVTPEEAQADPGLSRVSQEHPDLASLDEDIRWLFYADAQSCLLAKSRLVLLGTNLENG